MLIVIEGIDGSGKSTLAQSLAHTLEKEGYSIQLTREPGGSLLGKNLREILQNQPMPITPIAEFLLFAADRAQHFTDVVLPALAQNKIVISDRMGDSSLVYQGFGRGIDTDKISQVNEWAMQNIKPDLTVYMHINPSIAEERLRTRKKLTTFEKEQKTFVQKLIHGFDTIYANRSDVIILDATQSPENVLHDALKAIRKWTTKLNPQSNQINCS